MMLCNVFREYCPFILVFSCRLSFTYVRTPKYIQCWQYNQVLIKKKLLSSMLVDREITICTFWSYVCSSVCLSIDRPIFKTFPRKKNIFIFGICIDGCTKAIKYYFLMLPLCLWLSVYQSDRLFIFSFVKNFGYVVTHVILNTE